MMDSNAPAIPEHDRPAAAAVSGPYRPLAPSGARGSTDSGFRTPKVREAALGKRPGTIGKVMMEDAATFLRYFAVNYPGTRGQARGMRCESAPPTRAHSTGSSAKSPSSAAMHPMGSPVSRT